MNENIQEQLSALMDGELARDETRFLIKRMTVDQELPLRWARYHVVRQTLRRQELCGVPANFADGVMARLQSEPSVRSHSATWLRWGAGGAIAASVAVSALVLTRPGPLDAPMAPTSGAVARAVAQQGASISTAPVSATTSAPNTFRAPLLPANAPIETAPVSFGADFSQPISIDPRLQSYLTRHYQSVGGNGQPALVPYVLLGTPQRETSTTQSGEAVLQNR